ncbi:MAG: DNA mismatch repair endonuclease MutL [Sphingobacteriaceae bacterium]|nr:DNA mismatch repair endonuclease MutL [Sphingobacteriaceae bacterium]
MSNVISLLPENVANQIAAGEVVQRPASVVKELLENAIDAGASHIKLIIKDAGKSLIQVIDNGNGMSPFDARLAFERHATSKIKSADDLFNLHTKGFRGEALASIAAVAQVELKTKQATDEVGQQITIEGGNFIEQTNCQCATGATFTIKNLFYNIPARRNFLKDDSTELKHIITEFERVALPHHNIHFTLHSNNNEIYNLPPTPLMQRIMGLFGNYFNQRLVTVDEQTPYVKISGYCGKPDIARKSKKDQYFFINNRFVRSPYLSTAVYQAYKDLISMDSHPVWFLFLDIDPKQIDVNIHPTKTEIKFIDERTVFVTLMSVVKRALGKANLGPSIDFDTESITQDHYSKDRVPVQPTVSYNKDYDPFKSTAGSGSSYKQENNVKHWETLFEGFKTSNISVEAEDQKNQEVIESVQKEAIAYKTFQLFNKYIVCNVSDGILVIDQQRAHERILYEHYFKTKEQAPLPSQQILFPEQLELSAKDFSLVESLLPELKLLGFDIEIFGKNSIVVNGAPSDLENTNVAHTIENIIESFKLNTIDSKIDVHDNICRAMAKNTSIKQGKTLDDNEMQLIIHHLMHCEGPNYTADGKTIFMNVEKDSIDKHFRNK